MPWIQNLISALEICESLREWSAYGAGVPLMLNGSDSVGVFQRMDRKSC
jgi:hypothetical protein